MSLPGYLHQQRPGIDLQLCLINLPTPIIAVCRSRTVVFANRAAEKLLSREGATELRDTLNGRQLADLNINVLYDESWEYVLHKFDFAWRSSRDDSTPTDVTVHEVEVVVQGAKGHPRQFRILLSSLMDGDETKYILTFEQALNTRISPFTSISASASSKATTAPDNETQTTDFGDTQRYKATTFENSNTAGFIINSDATFYIPNKKIKSLLGESVGDPRKHNYPGSKTWLEFWDEDFTSKIREADLPGIRLVRSRKAYKNCRYGLTISETGTRYILTASGDCLYDDDDQFIGGVCWFTCLQKLADFLVSERQKDLRSHETICNLLPHMVWTTKADAETCDWFSKRWFDYTGMTEDEALGTGFARAFHPDDYPRILEELAIHNASKEEFQIQMRFRRHDGCYRWMLARAVPILDEHGEILRWYGTNTDIHEATVARLHADAVKDQIMAVLSHADVSLFAIDCDGEVSMAEGQALSIVARAAGQDKADFVGHDAVELARYLDLPGSASL
jgi:PAS domain S-box-containing protein